MRSATVNLRLIESNASKYTEKTGNTRVDLRADAFGHGLEKVAPILYRTGARICVLYDKTQKALLEQIGFEVEIVEFPIPPFSHEIYGLSEDKNYTPATRLESTLILNKKLPKGTGVSYCWTYTTESETNVGLIGIGYADGLPFQAQGKVSIEGKNYPIVGRIAMDHMVGNFGNNRHNAGVKVVVWGNKGNEPTVKDWANAANIDPLCLTSMLSSRVKKTWI